MKNICLVMDSFKGSATSEEIETYIETGIHQVNDTFRVTKVPITDGGEGFTRIMTTYLGGELHTTHITGPYGKSKQALWGIVQDKVIIEVAEAAGLNERQADDSPFFGTSYGVGELINQILGQINPAEILIGLGGSATNDAGAGMAQALGYQFLDQNRQVVTPIPQNFDQIVSVDETHVNPKLKTVSVVGLTDVVNPLLGLDGATYKYGHQKGLAVNKMPLMDHRLAHFAAITETFRQARYRSIPGSGAAGGIGFGILAFLNGTLAQAMPKVIELFDIKSQIQHSDLVITGEGQLDSQSMDGKVSCEIAKIAQSYRVPVIGLVGNLAIAPAKLKQIGFDAVFTTVVGPQTLQSAMASIEKNVTLVSEQIVRTLMLSSCI